MKIKVELDIEKWNTLINLLNELPFKFTYPIAPIMEEIIDQGKKHAKHLHMQERKSEQHEHHKVHDKLSDD